jgi:1,4-dihydroxy-2-naphthoate octaprenyltransferase
MMNGAASRPSSPVIWAMASRPRTLTAAILPVVVGSALAAADGAFRPIPALAAFLGAIAIQIGTNFANDYFDAVKGADRERQGPIRVTQAGLVTRGQIRRAIAIAFGFAFLCGIYLVAVAGWPIAAVGILSILSGLAYTGGPYPLGYHGLGEIFVFVFFGLVAVAGTYYVQALRLTASVVLLACPIGLLSTAILVANNLRDAETDRRSGKLTLVARHGRGFGRIEYAALLAGAFAIPPALFLAHRLPAGGLLPLLALPLAAPLLRQCFRAADPVEHVRLLVGTSRLLLVFGLLLSMGVFL